VATILRAGLVGCGSVAQRGILPHLSQDDARERLHIVAVVDSVEERARQSAARFGIPAYFSDVESMLEATDLDLVLVASPIPYHFAHAMAALVAGKHVYVQKAMTATLEEANALLAARDRAGVLLAAAPGFELCTTTRAMRRVVAEDRLGRVYIAYTYTLGFGHERESIRQGDGVLAAIDPSWYYRPGAGPLPDVTVYALQLATSVLGPVRRITALANRGAAARDWRGQTVPVAVEDNNLLALEFATGTLAVAVGANCWGSARNPWGGLGLYGTEGRLEVTDVEMTSGYPVTYELQTVREGSQPITYSTSLAEQPYLRGMHLQLEEPHIYVDIMDLVDAIGEGRPPRATGEQARHVVEIIERARMAAATGQTQTLVSGFIPTEQAV
jgi:predicted dehydrogenase